MRSFMKETFEFNLKVCFPGVYDQITHRVWDNVNLLSVASDKPKGTFCHQRLQHNYKGYILVRQLLQMVSVFGSY